MWKSVFFPEITGKVVPLSPAELFRSFPGKFFPFSYPHFLHVESGGKVDKSHLRELMVEMIFFTVSAYCTSVAMRFSTTSRE